MKAMALIMTLLAAVGAWQGHMLAAVIMLAMAAQFWTYKGERAL